MDDRPDLNESFNKAVEWLGLDEMEARRAACADLIIRLEDVIAHPNT